MRQQLQKYIVILTTLAIILSSALNNIQAATAKSMNIYAFYLTINKGSTDLTEEEKNDQGEAVLVESKGHYLLMDTGDEYLSDSLVATLKAMKVKEMDLYFSHFHSDHVRGINALAKTDIKVNKIYFPDESLWSDYYVQTKNGTATMENEMRRLNACYPESKYTYVRLKKGSTFSFGDVTAEVLGPLSTYEQDKYGNDKWGKKSGHYLNNVSLTTMMTCGKTKFLTGGDVESNYYQDNYSFKMEEEKLVDKYGSKLKADIYKMNHHGLKTSNSPAFLKAVKAKYAFACNLGHEETETTINGNKCMVNRDYTAVKEQQKYGLTYLLGQEKKTLQINVKDNVITLKTKKLTYDSNKIVTKGDMDPATYSWTNKTLTGWVKLYGDRQKSNGDFTGKDFYYIKNHKLLSGVQKINKKYYYFTNLENGKTGYAALNAHYEYNKTKKKYVYKGWRIIDGGYYYSSKPNSSGLSTIYRGFRKVKDTNTGKYWYYYFDPGNYCRAKNKKKATSGAWKIVKIGKYKYAIKKNSGVVYNYGTKRSAFLSFGKKKRAFKKNGRMITGKAKVNGKYHTFSKKTGYMIK